MVDRNGKSIVNYDKNSDSIVTIKAFPITDTNLFNAAITSST